MTEYLETRAEAIRIIDRLVAINAEYKRIATSGGPGAQQELVQLIAREEMTLREGVTTLGNDARLKTVISAEPPLIRQVSGIGQFWVWLQQNGLVKVGEDLPNQEARTELPPEPSEQITGPDVMDYLQRLHGWLQTVSAELWGDENPIELPVLGDRYGIGDFGQTQIVANILSEGMGLKAHWIQLASCGAYWDTVSVGSARAKLIYKGVDILTQLLHPPG